MYQTKFTPSELKQCILAQVKPLFYSGSYAGRQVTVYGEIANNPQTYGQVIYFNLTDRKGCSLTICCSRSALSVNHLLSKGLSVEVFGILDIQDKSNKVDWDIYRVLNKAETLTTEGLRFPSIIYMSRFKYYVN